ncbi:MAG: isochorismatase family protein [Actinomycetota bacterium]|nr:isochorismatase family protein [Actinomycetota bacterium]
MTHVADTTPYPWPWDGRLPRERTALVVTGCDPASIGAASVTPEVGANLSRLRAVVDHAFTISHRLHLRRPLAPAGEPGVFDIGRLDAVALDAAGIDGFFGSPLDATLRSLDLDRLLVAGFGLETTVHSTLRSANDAGLECLVVVDACAPVDPDLVTNAVSMIEMSGGIFGAVGRTDDVVAALAAAASESPAAHHTNAPPTNDTAPTGATTSTEATL